MPRRIWWLSSVGNLAVTLLAVHLCGWWAGLLCVACAMLGFVGGVLAERRGR